ncbi:MAG: hypothetical protein HQL10_12280 [Nitrospirae bacterium]|nr:hypothetical protein [Nitrospirota bacterium]
MNNKPVLIIKFQCWRILWRLFWPISLFIPLCCFIAMKIPMKYSGFEFWVYETLCLFGVVGGIWMICEMLLVKDFCLYEDRIIQKYKLFKKDKQVLLDKSKYTAMTTPFWGHIAIYEVGRYCGRIQFDPTLVNTNTIKEFYLKLSQLSGRNIEELKNKTIATKLIIQ